MKMCPKLYNAKEPLFLPAGSVRAILAIMIIPPVVLASVALMILMFVQNQFTISLSILSGLTGLAGSIVGYYFGSKAADKATSAIVDAHSSALQAKDAVIDTHVNTISNLQNLLQRN